MSLGENLRRLRENKGYMQKDVAEALDIAPNTLSGYESDKRSPDSKTLIKLAEFYNTTVDELLGTASDEVRILSKTYFSFAKELQDKNIPVEDLKKLLDFYNQINSKK
jgi:transcriptional regulator with XRE-family HTH domain